MKTLALLSLAAATAAIAIPSAASAQPRAGHSWGDPARGGQRVIVRHGPGAMPGDGNVRREFRRFQRIDRGGFLPPFFAGPQFHVQHWQMYGFPQPMPGYRWVRYYDDALLVDGRGRVRDGRYGFDWDRYGDHWGSDPNGIPVYVGDGDYHPDERDYARGYDRRGDGGWDYSEYGYEERHGGDCRERRRGPCGPRHPGPGYGHGYGYGYGHGGYYGAQSYGYGGATETIVETIVESGGATVIEEVVEEVVETRARRHHRRPAPPPRRPIRGERG